MSLLVLIRLSFHSPCGFLIPLFQSSLEQFWNSRHGFLARSSVYSLFRISRFKRRVLLRGNSLFFLLVVSLFHKYNIYQRWGDAPVHSMAAALFASRDQIHFFDDIGYQHDPYTHCPRNRNKWRKGRCSCEPKQSFGKAVLPPWGVCIWMTLIWI